MFIYEIIDLLSLYFPDSVEGRSHRRAVINLQKHGLLNKRPKDITAKQALYIAYGLLPHFYFTPEIEQANEAAINDAIEMIEGRKKAGSISISEAIELSGYSDTRTVTLSSKVLAVLQTVYLNDQDEAAILMGE